MNINDFEIFVVSCDDDKYHKFLERIQAAIYQPTVTRINITPETNTIAQPEWFRGARDRWALQCAWITCLNRANTSDKHAWMMEDDCIFIPNFSEKLNNFIGAVPDDWNSLYLGGQLVADWCYPYIEVEGNPYVLKPSTVHRCHSWMVRKGESSKRVIKQLNDKDHKGDCVCDWFLPYLHLNKEKAFNLYIPADGWYCGQGSFPSQLMNSDEPERWWHFKEDLAKKEAEYLKEWNKTHYSMDIK